MCTTQVPSGRRAATTVHANEMHRAPRPACVCEAPPFLTRPSPQLPYHLPFFSVLLFVHFLVIVPQASRKSDPRVLSIDMTRCSRPLKVALCVLLFHAPWSLPR